MTVCLLSGLADEGTDFFFSRLRASLQGWLPFPLPRLTAAVQHLLHAHHAPGEPPSPLPRHTACWRARLFLLLELNELDRATDFFSSILFIPKPLTLPSMTEFWEVDLFWVGVSRAHESKS